MEISAATYLVETSCLFHRSYTDYRNTPIDYKKERPILSADDVNVHAEEFLKQKENHYVYVLILLQKEDAKAAKSVGISNWFETKKND